MKTPEQIQAAHDQFEALANRSHEIGDRISGTPAILLLVPALDLIGIAMNLKTISAATERHLPILKWVLDSPDTKAVSDEEKKEGYHTVEGFAERASTALDVIEIAINEAVTKKSSQEAKT